MQVGAKEAHKVVVEGVGAECNFCGVETNYLIYLYKNQIKSVEINNR